MPSTMLRRLSILFFFTISLACRAEETKLPLTGQILGTNTLAKIESGEKGLVVVFLSARCPCSDSHIPLIKDLAREFPQFKFVAVHSNMDEPEASAKDYFALKNLPFPILQDDHTRLANLFSAGKTPHVFVMWPSGKIAYQGGVTDSHDAAQAKAVYLREALVDLNAGREVRSKRRPTLGCAISRVAR